MLYYCNILPKSDRYVLDRITIDLTRRYMLDAKPIRGIVEIPQGLIDNYADLIFAKVVVRRRRHAEEESCRQSEASRRAIRNAEAVERNAEEDARRQWEAEAKARKAEEIARRQWEKAANARKAGEENAEETRR